MKRLRQNDPEVNGISYVICKQTFIICRNSIFLQKSIEAQLVESSVSVRAGLSPWISGI